MRPIPTLIARARGPELEMRGRPGLVLRYLGIAETALDEGRLCVRGDGRPVEIVETPPRPPASGDHVVWYPGWTITFASPEQEERRLEALLRVRRPVGREE